MLQPDDRWAAGTSRGDFQQRSRPWARAQFGGAAAIAEAERSLMCGDADAREGGEWVDAPCYFGAVCSALSSAQLEPRGIRCEFRTDEGAMPARTAQTLALILAELVTNAAKHGFAGRSSGAVGVFLRRSGQGWMCGVRDNGRGIEGHHVGQGSGRLAALVRSVGAQLRVHSDQSGVLACLAVPGGGSRPGADGEVSIAS